MTPSISNRRAASGERSLSAVYTYYDPEHGRLSPGVFSILTQLRLCAEWGLRWLYLGLAIEQSEHMRYKLDWYPHERRIDGAWRRFTSRPAALDGVFVTQGKNVVEIAVREASKGAAIERLTEQADAGVAVFIGDDVTDERGFARLRTQDVGIKVGEGETVAGHRVADIPAVVRLLGTLADLRS